MNYRSFRQSNERVSRLGFGAMGLGGAFGNHDETALIYSLHHSLERGINFIDTARIYGQSESIIGKALKLWNGERPFLASKVAPQGPSWAWGMPVPVQTAYPPGSVTSSVEKSLQELGVDCIDLMQLHQYWPGWEKESYWLEELQTLKQQGKIHYIGVSIPDHRHDVALTLVQSGLIDSVQTIVNVFDPLSLDCLLPACEANGVAFIARCVLDEGGLTGFLQPDTTFGEQDFRNTFFNNVPKEQYIERVEKLRKYIPEYADSLAQLAIRFALHQPGVTTAVVSMHIPQYADDNIAALASDPLPHEIFEELRRHHRWIRNFYDTKYWK